MTDELDIPTLFPSKLDDEPGPAQPITDAAKDALVANAMAACGIAPTSSGLHPRIAASTSQPASAPPPAPPALRVVSSPPSRRGRSATKRAVPAAVIVAALGFSSAAAALSGYWVPVVQQWVKEWEPVSTPERLSAPVAKSKTAPGRTEQRAPEKEAELEDTGKETTAPANDEISEPTPPSSGSASGRGVAKQAAPQLNSSQRTKNQSRKSEQEETQPRVDPLAVANTLRAQKRYDAALAKYLEIVNGGAATGGATAARVSAATLLLRQRRAQQAKRLLLPITTARAAMPEAVLLLARAYEGAGERQAAIRTLRRFIRSYPNHPSTRRASTRLAKLNGAQP